MSEKITFAFLGPEGTHSHLALEEYNSKASDVACRTIANIFEKVANNEVDAGIVPMENMIQGPISETYDHFLRHKSKIKIVDSYLMTVNHALAVLLDKNYPREIKKIYSHEQPLRQCAKYLQENFPNAQLIPTTSTAAAIELIKTNNFLDAAVIAPVKSLKREKLQIISEEIADLAGNKTRFAIITRAESKNIIKNIKSQAQEVSSILIAPGRDRQGLLFDLLKIISVNHKINLATIHSRPDLKGRVVFYLDLEGGDKKLEIISCLDELKSFCEKNTGKSAEVINLGSYPYTFFYTSPIKTIGIIGANGKMGKWFTSFFQEAGLEVIACDKGTKENLEDIASKADTILISVPMSEASKVTNELLPLLKAGQLVIENCSIKSCILPKLTKGSKKDIEVLGIHTMFAADISDISGENVIITKTEKSANKAQAFEDLLYKRGAKIAQIDIEQHDQTAAFVQSLLQLCMLILADSMSSEFSSLEQIKSLSTPNFRNTLETISRVLNQNDSLILDLQTLNPKAENMRHKFLQSAFKLISALNHGNTKIIEDSIKKSRQFTS